MPTINSITERIERIGQRSPGLTSDECLLVADIADDILRYVHRHRRELASVLASEPVAEGSPIDYPGSGPGTSASSMRKVYDYMLAHDDDWQTRQSVVDGTGLTMHRVRYSFIYMKSKGFLIRGPDLPRPGGGPVTKQYRLARKEE